MEVVDVQHRKTKEASGFAGGFEFTLQASREISLVVEPRGAIAFRLVAELVDDAAATDVQIIGQALSRKPRPVLEVEQARIFADGLRTGTMVIVGDYTIATIFFRLVTRGIGLGHQRSQ